MLAGSWVKTRLDLLDNILASTAYLQQWKFDYETYWDDAFARAFARGRNDGNVGGPGGPSHLVLPPHPGNLGQGFVGLKITQTIKVPAQVYLKGQGGQPNPRSGTLINGEDLLDTDDNLDRDIIHWGADEAIHVHNSGIENIRVTNAKRHGLSTHVNAVGENTVLDNFTATLCSGGAGVHIGAARAFKPLRIGALNFARCQYGLSFDAPNFRSQAYIGFVSGDDCLEDLIRVQGNPGAPTTALHIDRIKNEITLNTHNANVVNLRSGAGGYCNIGSIYCDLIATPPHATATYRCINATEDTANWRVNVGGFFRTDNSTAWDDELAFDDGTLQLTWADVTAISLDTRLQYRYNSWNGAGGQNGVDERIATTTTNLANISNGVNAANKYLGKRVYNVTLNRPVYADGSAAGAVWVFSDGTTAHTPI